MFGTILVMPPHALTAFTETTWYFTCVKYTRILITTPTTVIANNKMEITQRWHISYNAVPTVVNLHTENLNI